MQHLAAMKRVMVNLPDATGEIFDAKISGASPKISASSYVLRLVEADLKAAGLLGDTDYSEVLAYAEEIGKDRALTALRRAARKGKATR